MERTGRSVRISPPWLLKHSASASIILIEPPRTHGQLMACAASASTIPNEAVPFFSRGSTECAQHPAKSARAFLPLNLLKESPVHERNPFNAKRSMKKG